MPNFVTKAIKRAGKLVPKPMRKKIKTSGKRVVQQLPAPVQQAIGRPKKRVAQAKYPLDHLGLAEGIPNRLGKGAAKNVTGRAAAGTVIDEHAAERLHRAMFGRTVPERTAAGGRPIAGVFAPDLRAALVEAGHSVHPFVPGISSALAKQAEVVVLDIAGFTGVWDGALDPSGIGLIREVYAALETARARGVTCWLVMRGEQLHHHGAILLEGSDLVNVLVPGLPSAEQLHFTENPGEAPAGIVEIIRNLEVAA
ncbi:hypothetical protein [Gulosibacter chungangensis]|uniref:Uncharacterized protein n=1 Tax=Gulosibacter chungangensis TaxID=979746 RepID=A0A7J5B7I0_9MICO|nr:hypothetical protein [Gulosibacter chungangensis]KAB1640833.1 hypothetical protein F8O05_14130 [Gulosibacter chungangensis]